MTEVRVGQRLIAQYQVARRASTGCARDRQEKNAIKSIAHINVFLGREFVNCAFFVSGCGPGQLLGPTLTPTLMSTPAPTSTPIPTPTPTTGKVEGKVYWVNMDKPINAVVRLNSADTGTLTTTTTADGKYSLADIKPGVYLMSIKATLEGEVIPSCTGVNAEFSRNPDTDTGLMVMTTGDRVPGGDMEFSTAAHGRYTIPAGSSLKIDVSFWCP
jgi:hypothetical protein